jgi:glycosyltransferase involved in cell wall biosynthesis
MQKTISGYTTTKDCIQQKYPWKECISSMIGFCDEVVVVDGGSTDGTWEDLLSWSKSEPKLKIKQVSRDWNHKRHAVFDGAQKAEAKKLCTKDFCWQMDADEVVHENDYRKIKTLISNWPSGVELLSLPVIDFWGFEKKVRCDVNPWKWRLSINNPNITHGIPAPLRRTDEDGNLYAAQGTDGCDYVYTSNGEYVPHANFYTQEAHNARMHALNGHPQALIDYEAWFNVIVTNVPSVYHYSWVNIERKMHTYKNYWQKHWESLFDIKTEDTAANNMFFDKPWSEVSDEEISFLAKRLSSEMGGWIFHKKIDFSKPTPSIKLKTAEPSLMVKHV